MVRQLNEVAFLILGWLLGLLSPLLVERIHNERRRKDIQNGIMAELIDVKFRMASVVYITAMRFGQYDRELVNWLIPIVKEYQGNNPKENLLRLLEKHAALDDKNLSEVIEYGKADPGAGLSVKKYKLPYLEAKVGELSLFRQEFQRLALEILANLQLFNEEIDEARFYFKLTYDSGVSEENHARACGGSDQCYKNLGDSPKILIARITSLENI